MVVGAALGLGPPAPPRARASLALCLLYWLDTFAGRISIDISLSSGIGSSELLDEAISPSALHESTEYPWQYTA